MIKETDASKNDERRVKNKLNPLTHKRKGETRTMYNQSTKHWKLGSVFCYQFDRPMPKDCLRQTATTPIRQRLLQSIQMQLQRRQ